MGIEELKSLFADRRYADSYEDALYFKVQNDQSKKNNPEVTEMNLKEFFDKFQILESKIFNLLAKIRETKAT